MNVRRAVLAVASAICWTLAVGIGALSAAGFAGAGFACEAGHRRSCTPPTWMLIGGLLLAGAFGVAGALLYKPKPKRPQPLRPWEYRD